jgi:hypothetical protein
MTDDDMTLGDFLAVPSFGHEFFTLDATLSTTEPLQLAA